MRNVFVLITIVSLSMAQQQRAILYVNSQGVQDVIPIRAHETPPQVIEQYEQTRNIIGESTFFDTLRYFDKEGIDLGTNFGFQSQEIALQWFKPQTDGEVLEFWWRNFQQNGAKKKAKIRAWYIDPRVTEFPASRYDATGSLGYYAAKNGSVTMTTPFVEDAIDNIFLSTNKQDSVYVSFDPLKQETNWKPGGLVVDLVSDQWQSIKLKETGNSFIVKAGQAFGFTVQNFSLPTDSAIRLEISSKEVSVPGSGSHFTTSHSLKYYHQTNSTFSNYGWYVRQFDFGMYVVISYSNDNPFYTFGYINYNQVVPPNTSREIAIRVKNMNTFVLPAEIEKVQLKYKIGNAIGFETVTASVAGDTFKAILPGMSTGQSMYFYLTGYSINGVRFTTNITSISQPTSVTGINSEIKTFSLSQNYPNPFNPSTTVNYTLPKASYVVLKVYDILGKEVANLVDDYNESGRYTVEFDASKLPSGMYIYRITTGSFSNVKKMMLVK